MKYQTHDAIEFEIPDDWLARTGFCEAVWCANHYRSDGADVIIDIRQLSSPVRKEGVPGFHEDRMLPVLTGLVLNESVPPIEVDRPPYGPYPYRVRDGFHRYYASIAAGFERIPVKVLRFLDIGSKYSARPSARADGCAESDGVA